MEAETKAAATGAAPATATRSVFNCFFCCAAAEAETEAEAEAKAAAAAAARIRMERTREWLSERRIAAAVSPPRGPATAAATATATVTTAEAEIPPAARPSEAETKATAGATAAGDEAAAAAAGDDAAKAAVAAAEVEAELEILPQEDPAVLRVPEESPTLEDALARAKQSRGKIATIRVGTGTHKLAGGKEDLVIDDAYPLEIVGADPNGDPGATVLQMTSYAYSRRHICVKSAGREHGGSARGNSSSGSSDVVIRGLTLRGGKGLVCSTGLQMTNVIVDLAQEDGLLVMDGGRVLCTNFVVTNCCKSGVHTKGKNSRAVLQGEKTSLTNNVTRDDCYGVYHVTSFGLLAEAASQIILVSPLTLDTVSMGNASWCGGSRNWDLSPSCTFETWHSAECRWKPLTNPSEPTALMVPEDCDTLEQALERATGTPAASAITTIRLSAGTFEVEGECLAIRTRNTHDKLDKSIYDFPIEIIGAGEEKTIITGGGFKIGDKYCQHNGDSDDGDNKRSRNEVILRDMTIHATNGVWNDHGLPTKIVNVVVKGIDGNGVCASGHGEGGSRGRIECENVRVSGCKESGFFANQGGTIVLRGEKTLSTGNCTGTHDTVGLCHGLHAAHKSSSIRLVFPLTRETVSTGNGGGGDWGESSLGEINEVDEEGNLTPKGIKEVEARKERLAVEEQMVRKRWMRFAELMDSWWSGGLSDDQEKALHAERDTIGPVPSFLRGDKEFVAAFLPFGGAEAHRLESGLSDDFKMDPEVAPACKKMHIQFLTLMSLAETGKMSDDQKLEFKRMDHAGGNPPPFVLADKEFAMAGMATIARDEIFRYLSDDLKRDPDVLRAKGGV